MSQIFANPSIAVIDEEIEIYGTGLEPNSPVTISASIVHNQILYLGFGHYYADDKGSINLKKDISYGGTYKGLQPMALFTSMKAMPSKHACPRLLVTGSVEKPLQYKLTLWRNHLNQDEIHQLHVKFTTLGTMFPTDGYLDDYFLSSCNLNRTYLSPKVRRVPIKANFDDDVICGVLFIPDEAGPFPGVIDLFGGAGGCVEIRAALLAKHGFVSLALAYMAYEGLKAKKITGDIEMSYFDKAILWFSQHPKVKSGGISLVGASVGAQIALFSSVRNENVKSVICISSNGIMAIDPDSSNPMSDVIKLDAQGVTIFEVWRGRLTATVDHLAKVPRPLLRHRHDPRTLFLVGKYDPNHTCINDAIDQLRKSGKKNVFKRVVGGEGHFIEPPYMPLCVANTLPSGARDNVKNPYANLTDSIPWEWHGSQSEHGKGQVEAWNIILNFLKNQRIEETSKL